MAELLIPLLTLGGIYFLSNNDKDKKKKNIENFSNNGISREQDKILSDLPNTHVINPNFPNTTEIDLESKNFPRKYNNPNQTTDSLFDKNQILNTNLSNSTSQIDSINGNKIDTTKFKHNNMVPFFRGSETGANLNSHNESILDNKAGLGSQSIKRTEIGTLFNPSENSQNVFGMQNNSDFFQSRQLPSTQIRNVLPWEQKKVAPGLGLGFTTEGAMGYNSGVLEREAWKPRTVDQLRTANNPKETFVLDGHQGPAESSVTNRGFVGKVEKNRVNTMFETGPERWFTTTNGLGETQRPEVIIQDNNRIDTSTEYFGIKNSGGETRQNSYRGNYEKSNRIQLAGTDLTPVNAVGHGNSNGLTQQAQSFKILKNNRNQNCQPDTISAGGINGTFRAIMAPIVDILKPNRKENIIGNANEVGNITARVPNLPITNPLDRPKTTIKETTQDLLGQNHLNVSVINNGEGGYMNSQFQIKDQNRNYTNVQNFGNVQGQSGEPNRLAWDNQHNNVNKTYHGSVLPGGMDIFNGNINQTSNSNFNDSIDCRQPLPERRVPNQQSYNIPIPSKDTFGKVIPAEPLSNDLNQERINPDILTAFKNNPYAQPLNVY